MLKKVINIALPCSRFLELPDVTQQLVTMINHVGVLYKFHDRPVFYLYNTLHYYEKRLRDRVLLKKTLIAKIVGAFGDERPAGWCLSPQFQVSKVPGSI